MTCGIVWSDCPNKLLLLPTDQVYKVFAGTRLVPSPSTGLALNGVTLQTVSAIFATLGLGLTIMLAEKLAAVQLFCKTGVTI